MQGSSVVGNGLNAKYAFAFGIDLQSQVATVHFENGQIIRRFLDRDFPRDGMPFAFVIFRPMPVTEDGLDGLEIQGSNVDRRTKIFVPTRTAGNALDARCIHSRNVRSDRQAYCCSAFRSIHSGNTPAACACCCSMVPPEPIH